MTLEWQVIVVCCGALFLRVMTSRPKHGAAPNSSCGRALPFHETVLPEQERSETAE